MWNSASRHTPQVPVVLENRSNSIYFVSSSSQPALKLSSCVNILLLRKEWLQGIREYFDHLQNVESADKWREVHRSTLPEAKCPLRSRGMSIDAHIWQGNRLRKIAPISDRDFSWRMDWVPTAPNPSAVRHAVERIRMVG